MTSFGREDPTQTDVFVLDTANGEERPLLADPVASEPYPRLAPDERFLAHASDASGRMEIYVTTVPAGE